MTTIPCELIDKLIIAVIKEPNSDEKDKDFNILLELHDRCKSKPEGESGDQVNIQIDGKTLDSLRQSAPDTLKSSINKLNAGTEAPSEEEPSAEAETEGEGEGKEERKSEGDKKVTSEQEPEQSSESETDTDTETQTQRRKDQSEVRAAAAEARSQKAKEDRAAGVEPPPNLNILTTASRLPTKIHQLPPTKGGGKKIRKTNRKKRTRKTNKKRISRKTNKKRRSRKTNKRRRI